MVLPLSERIIFLSDGSTAQRILRIKSASPGDAGTYLADVKYTDYSETFTFDLQLLDAGLLLNKHQHHTIHPPKLPPLANLNTPKRVKGNKLDYYEKVYA